MRNQTSKMNSFLLRATLITSFAGAATVSMAHNQSPATIKRSMDKAFKSLDSSAPANVFKGQRTVRASGSTAQIFDAQKDGKLVGYVAQLEFQEETYVVAVDATTKQVSAVARAGTLLEQAEWKDLGVVEEVRKILVGK